VTETADEPTTADSADSWASYFVLGLLAALFVRALSPATPDPLDELRQRVATLEGKVSR